MGYILKTILYICKKKIKMKTLFTLAFIFLIFTTAAQTSLEEKVFQKINEYRDSLQLSKLEWDSACYKGSSLQSTYLKSTNGIVSHNNKNESIKNAKERFKLSGGKKTLLLAEICNSTNKNYKVVDTLIEEKLAIEIVALWKKSPTHNKMMINPRMRYGGCSVKIITSSTGIKTYLHYNTISVMLLFE